MSKKYKHISQPNLIAGICEVLDKLGVKEAEPRIVNVVIKAANDILAELERDPVMATEGMGLHAWLKSDDTGMSSKYMASVLCGAPLCENKYPLDPSDFGRCYRFLKAVPEARTRLHLMAESGPVWAGYVERWDEMEKLYEAASNPSSECEIQKRASQELYEIMQWICYSGERRKQ